ncbi:MAG: hypothetical protein GY915_05030, partial [bacterium]|nr:hypothetical protein [bacterium]
SASWSFKNHSEACGQGLDAPLPVMEPNRYDLKVPDELELKEVPTESDWTQYARAQITKCYAHLDNEKGKSPWWFLKEKTERPECC